VDVRCTSFTGRLRVRVFTTGLTESTASELAALGRSHASQRRSTAASSRTRASDTPTPGASAAVTPMCTCRDCCTVTPPPLTCLGACVALTCPCWCSTREEEGRGHADVEEDASHEGSEGGSEEGAAVERHAVRGLRPQVRTGEDQFLGLHAHRRPAASLSLRRGRAAAHEVRCCLCRCLPCLPVLLPCLPVLLSCLPVSLPCLSVCRCRRASHARCGGCCQGTRAAQVRAHHCGGLCGGAAVPIAHEPRRVQLRAAGGGGV
jgi:hypothetical protein